MTSDEASSFLLRYYTWFVSMNVGVTEAEKMATSVFIAVSRGQVEASPEEGDGPSVEEVEAADFGPLDDDEDIPF